MNTNYRPSFAASINLTSLASSGGLLAGRCMAAYSNATFKDDWVAPWLKTRSGGTAPTAGGQIELWAFAQRADGVWPELFTTAYTGADGGFTIVSRDILFAGAVLLANVTNDATANRDYVLRGRQLESVFGAVPQAFSFFVTQSTGQPLSATAGDHSLTINAGTYT
jgi:hypothetical protein